MANFVTANIVAANEGLNSALDGLDALTSGIIGGILSIPAIPTALVTAQHAIMVAQIIKALPKLPSLLIQDVNLQAELITLATLKEAITIKGAKIFGRIEPNIILILLTPSAFAASTYSFSF